MIDINDGRRLRTYEREELLRRPHGALLAALEELQLPDPIAWFTNRFGSYLHRFILSHPDVDHLAGIRRLIGGELTVENFWDVPHSRTLLSQGGHADSRDWQTYDRFRRGGISSVTWRLSPMAGAVGNFWTADGIEILAPTHLDVLFDAIANRCNDSSYVLRISHAGRSILIPGDIEETGWRRLLDRGIDLRADVLVASHHGRRSGYFEPAIRAIAPSYVVVSTGPLPSAEDGHRLYRARVLPGNFFSTRSHGTISIRFHDSGWVQVVPERRPLLRGGPGLSPLAAVLAERPPMPPPSLAGQALARLLRERRRTPLR
jgi:hypothetical protein